MDSAPWWYWQASESRGAQPGAQEWKKTNNLRSEERERRLKSAGEESGLTPAQSGEEVTGRTNRDCTCFPPHLGRQAEFSAACAAVNGSFFWDCAPFRSWPRSPAGGLSWRIERHLERCCSPGSNDAVFVYSDLCGGRRSGWCSCLITRSSMFVFLYWNNTLLTRRTIPKICCCMTITV